MSSTAEPWEPWAGAMRAAEIGDPRNGRPSWTQLAHAAKVSTSTVTKAVNGQRTAEPGTIQALARALRVKPETVSEWLKVPVVRGPYTPPDEAALLADHEREAISGLIRAIVRGREKGNDGTSTTPAGSVSVRRTRSTSRMADEDSGPGRVAPSRQPSRDRKGSSRDE